MHPHRSTVLALPGLTNLTSEVFTRFSGRQGLAFGGPFRET